MYYIIELANTHGGNLDYLMDLIKQFEGIKPRSGMKFQAFSPDKIATRDFEWYPVYEELHFLPGQWKDIIKEAGKTKDIWLDIFDEYGIQILNENAENIYGIKFQSSVLLNREVMNELKNTDLKDKYLIVNIAAQSMESIEKIVNQVEKDLNPKEIWLEIGFQSYPTELTDSGLNKIEILKSRFGKKLVFADHTDGKSDDAIYLPLVASTRGIDVIEKHIMLDDRETKYDHFSSITFPKFEQLIEKISQYETAFNSPFINERERIYLEKSMMNPILKKDKLKGQTVNLEKDFSYRRTGQSGLNSRDIALKAQEKQILRRAKKAGQSLQHADYKAATIAAIIACRLKSSRLPGKALENIGSLTSVELCISNALKFEHVNEVILATSTEPQDDALVNYTFDQSVIFHRGDPDDVISRFLGITGKTGVDVIIRITADMPFIDPEICAILLESHFSSGADYTTANKSAVGTNLEIINTEALQRVTSHFGKAEYSEYMTWYFQNNPEYFNLNFVDLPQDLVRDYRLTLDYPEDLEMFNAIAEHFSEAGKNDYSLREIFAFLDANPEIAAINQNCVLTYKTDEKLIALLNEKTKIQ